MKRTARSALSTIGLLCLLANPALAQTTDATNKVPGELSAALARATRMFDVAGEGPSRTYKAVQPQQGYAAEVGPQGALKIGLPGNTIHMRGVSLGRGAQRTTIESPKIILGKDAEGWSKLTLSRSNLTEWYVNGQEGLHHWMRLSSRPGNTSDSARVWVRMSLSGDVKLSHVADGVVQMQTEGIVLSYGGLKVWDSKRRELPAHFDISGQNLSIMVDDRGATYPVTIDPLWTQQQAMAPPGGPSHFGISVAMEGNTAVIGDIGSLATGFKGAAYVFKRSPSYAMGSWNFFQKLTDTESTGEDWFGKSVAISKNGILVGAPHANNARGKAIMYLDLPSYPGDYQASSLLHAPDDGAPGHRFGSHVALYCPRYDNLYTRAAVSNGVEESTPSNPIPGKVYTFVDDPSVNLGLLGIGIITYPFATGQAQFGRAIAMDGQGDNAPVTLLVGDPGGTNGTGIVFGYLHQMYAGPFFRPNVGIGYMFLPDGPGQRFGYDIAMRGGRIVVGAPGPGSGSSPGAAYFIAHASSFGGEKFVLPNGTPNMRFGASVGIDGNRMLVGAPGDTPTTMFGSAHIFSVNYTGSAPTVITLQQSLAPSDAHYGQQFGSAVAISGSKILVGTDQISSPNGAYFFWKAPDTTVYVPGSILGGFQGVGKIMISIPAPEGGVVLRLRSSSTSFVVPSTLTIPEGETTAEFIALTAPVATDTRVELLASASGFTSTSAGITVLAPSMTKLRFNRSEVNFGGQATGILRLNGPASLGGLTYPLTQSPGQLKMPETVFVPAGQTEGSFTVIGNRTTSGDAIQTVRAGSAGVSTSATIVVRSLVELQSLTLSPGTIGLGQSTSGTVTLMSPAPAAGQTVMLTSEHSSVTLPASVAVPGGSTTAQFTINTTGATALPVKLSASVGAATKSATLHFKPLALRSLVLARRSISELSSTTLTVKLNYPVPSSFAPQRYLIVSSVPGAVRSQAVYVKPGESMVVVPIKPTFGNLPQPKPVELAWNRGETNERITTLTLNPAVKSFTLSPTTVGGGAVSVGTITLFEPLEGSFTAASSSTLAYFDATTNPIRTNAAGTVYRFMVRTRAPKETTTVNISVSGLGYIRRAALTIQRP